MAPLFPAVVNETYWFVRWLGDTPEGDTYWGTSLITRHKSEAIREYETQLRCTGPDVELVGACPVFLPRCGVCGEYATPVFWAARDWDELADEIRSSPGWTVTAEQHVYCPHHRPGKEE